LREFIKVISFRRATTALRCAYPIDHRRVAPCSRAVAGLGLLVLGTVWAEDPPWDPGDRIELAQLPTVVVINPWGRRSSGTKTDTPLTETPQSVSVISAEDIADHGATSMMEALRYTAGATVETFGTDPRGYDWVMLRGFDSFDSQFRDGMRLFDYMFMESYGLDRLEVLRGPSSVLYGQSVPGGLINGVSELPTDTPHREVELSGGISPMRPTVPPPGRSPTFRASTATTP
jgi:outer membrane receptor protein involved in Fe transport